VSGQIGLNYSTTTVIETPANFDIFRESVENSTLKNIRNLSVVAFGAVDFVEIKGQESYEKAFKFSVKGML
jgi:hypothetical protein